MLGSDCEDPHGPLADTVNNTSPSARFMWSKDGVSGMDCGPLACKRAIQRQGILFKLRR